MFRIIFRGGDYIDVEADNAALAVGPQDLFNEPVWAVIDLEILEGGDAYQALVRTLESLPIELAQKARAHIALGSNKPERGQ